MILGIDHLSFNTRDKKRFEEKIFNYKKLYNVKALNHKEKNKFISKKLSITVWVFILLKEIYLQ